MAIFIATGTSLTSASLTDLDSFAATAINAENREVPVVDVPALSSSPGPMPKLYGKLWNPGNVTVPGYLDTLRDFAPGTDLGNTTITYPQQPGETAPATMIGAATLVSESKAFPVEEVATQELAFNWNAGYNFTAATTT